MGVSGTERFLRQLLIWLLAFVIIIFAFVGIVSMKTLSEEGFNKPFVIKL